MYIFACRPLRLGDETVWTHQVHVVSLDIAWNAGAPVAGGWRVPNATVHLISQLTIPGVDEVTQHFAVHTIENVVLKVRLSMCRPVSCHFKQLQTNCTLSLSQEDKYIFGTFFQQKIQL